MAVIPFLNLFFYAVLGSAAIVWTARVFSIRRFRLAHPPLEPVGFSKIGLTAPKVSVIIPARDEEKNIGHCLTHLFKEDYGAFEIIIVDDRSSDRTPHLLENLKKLSSVPMKIIRIEKLPPGWTGKNYAMHTGSKAASGEWLLFTDADTTHTPLSIGSAIQSALAEKTDLLTLAPEAESVTFWEKTVQPIAMGSLAVWFKAEELANGQFLLVKRAVYESVGGNEAVKDKVVEDIEFARKIRQAGFKTRFSNGTKLYRTRMYTSLDGIITGWTRILTHLFEKNIWKFLEKIGMFLIFSIAPFLILTVEIVFGFTGSLNFQKQIFLLSLSVSGLIIGIRFAGNRLLRCSPWHAFLHPIGSAIMVWVLLKCIGRVIANLPSVWKGERYA